MKYYASVIQKLRNELGLPPANFPHLDIDEAIKKKENPIKAKTIWRIADSHDPTPITTQIINM